MSRLPIRLRLTLAFAAAMAVVLTAVGGFLYVRLGSSLDQALEDGLRARSDDVAALVRGSGSGLDRRTHLAERGESLAQVLGSSGVVIDSTAGPAALLFPAETLRALQAPVLVERRSLPGREDPVRLLAAPVQTRAGARVVVVGASLEGRAEALSGLLTQLLAVVPAALLLASLLGYALAAGALRPVESMRRQAEAIGESEPGRRLPVPASRDEISRLGETLNEMLARLEHALERERRFVAEASHELRTPLSLLKAELDLALRRPRTREELEAALSSAAEETDRLTRLAEDMLVLARADNGRLPLRLAEMDVGATLRRVADRFASRDRVETEAPAGLIVSADELRVEQALANLVDNALRHGGGGVLLTAAADEDRVVVHVLDDGPGFPPDFLPRAFERFGRPSGARSGPGSGLGLAIAAVIARAHGGTAGAANRDGGGADVWLELRR